LRNNFIKMRNILFGFIILSAICLSCSKKAASCNLNDSNVTASASEIASVQAYLTANSITATQHPSGFFYKITQAGTGQAVVNLCSMVSVKYAGRLTNGTYFDPTTPGTTTSASFTLGQVIVGWQKRFAINKLRRKDNIIHSPFSWLWK